MFDGNTTDVGGFTVTINRAQKIVCWDDGCSGDDTGPFDFLRMLVVANGT